MNEKLDENGPNAPVMTNLNEAILLCSSKRIEYVNDLFLEQFQSSIQSQSVNITENIKSQKEKAEKAKPNKFKETLEKLLGLFNSGRAEALREKKL